ncbi:MAG TPA: UbiA family prenyltransferase [Firmicutes bacterium]|uniref:UbiA family prenyltransferase n=1 Tax=Capillibacterium thermochitinicola TaxID=2699427 RepID=A0A8J6I184_9FIRM|nr:UbiA family prenyltransferase [Capillibacterium thermochitinicola]MBA2133408.1 UbiA family prenyltransferase [Capillibacterium thermochitinicola]HHW12949.1 UbiA family prenyltransferase [Bacillota bacterium]
MDIGVATCRAERSEQPLIRRIFRYVEIKTKITSTFPFLMGLAYLYSSGYAIDPLRTVVFFLGMFCFDLTATMINNYCDTKKNRQTLPFPRPTAKVLLLLMFAVSVALGLYLVYLSDLVVLFLGALCFFFGVIYSFGPVPISHGPYGEIVSGFFYGLVIPGILFYINIPAGGLFSYALADGKLSLLVDLRAMIGLLMLSVVPFCLTANIMLANNICDVERDVAVRRYTLAYYLGRKGLWLFAALYYLAYLSVVAMVVLGFLSPLSLLLLLTLIPVQKNINLFLAKQDKDETFNVAVKNFLLVIIPHTVLIFLGGLLSAR